MGGRAKHCGVVLRPRSVVEQVNVQAGVYPSSRRGEGRKKDTTCRKISPRLLQIYICNTTSFDINKVQYVLYLECYRLPQVQRGGVKMDNIINFVVVVMAGVVCHGINKWLDGDK